MKFSHKIKQESGNLVCGLLLLPVLFLLSGCNEKDAKSLATDSRKLAQSSGVALGNATLAGKVNSVLAVWKGVEMGFKVEAEDGKVTLSGEVRNAEERQRILNVVQSIRGVDKIINKLTIKKK